MEAKTLRCLDKLRGLRARTVFEKNTCLGGLLEAIRGPLGPILGVLGGSWEALGASWGPLGASWDASWSSGRLWVRFFGDLGGS